MRWPRSPSPAAATRTTCSTASPPHCGFSDPRRHVPQRPPLRAAGFGGCGAFELRALLADASQNGSYFIDVRDREGLDEVARELGHAVAAIDLAGCRDKDDVLDRFAAALHFPDWFGRNWDALADCLGDLRSEEHTSELQSLM